MKNKLETHSLWHPHSLRGSEIGLRHHPISLPLRPTVSKGVKQDDGIVAVILFHYPQGQGGTQLGIYRNLFSVILIGHSVSFKKDYGDIKRVFELLKYDEHKWIICVDLKMFCFLLGQQKEVFSQDCFLCMWDSQARKNHWVKREWPLREQLTPRVANVVHEPLVDREKFVFPPLRIKFGLIKQFIKPLDYDDDSFKFSQLNDGKKRARLSFKSIVTGFLGNEKSENYREIVQELFSAQLHTKPWAATRV